MKTFSAGLQRIRFFVMCGLIAAVSAACSGSGGGAAATPAPTPPPVSSPPPGSPPATALNITITRVSINSSHAPVVNFSVTNEAGARYPGLKTTDLRFDIAKLSPGVNGGPSAWQNYINRTEKNTTNANVSVQGTTETPALLAQSGSADAGKPGALVDNGDGTYTYTYKIDLTNTSQTCPSPCIDAQGNALDTSYQPNYTHRVAMYVQSPLPAAAGIYDFQPDGNVVTLERVIVDYAKCNECHERLSAHGGSRVDTRLCVTCHNPGSWDSTTGNTVDFKVLVHKIHRGSSLPSVVAGGDYGIAGFVGFTSFKDVVFPQEIRNCTKCHDGTAGAPNATPQGDYWKTDLSRAACGSCHDNIDFNQDGSATYQTTAVNLRTGHSGGVVTDDSQCITCHADGKAAGSVEANHNIDETTHQFIAKVQRAKFQFNILKICGTAVASNPVCAPGTVPTVTISVTDPTGGTHGYPNSTYNIFSDPEFWNSATNAPLASMSVDIAWNTIDYGNTGGYAARPSRANQINVFGTTGNSNNYGNATIPPYARATDNGDGTYTVTALGPIPDGTVWPNVAAKGSGAVAIEGRATADPLNTIPATTTRLRIPIRGAVAYFGITDSKPIPRRVVVDAPTKCDNCHDQLSLHGGSRNDNVQLCVICHNPENTDVPASSRHKFANGLSDGTVTARTPPYAYDGKKEESIDLKRMVHAIHASSVDAGGMRENGIVVSGTSFGDVEFPGILNHCTSCHVNRSYRLTGVWEEPTQNGILSSTVDSTPNMTSANTSAEVNASLQDPSDDYNISPTAAVCSSCHDTALEEAHMKVNGAVFGDDGASSTQLNLLGVIETCAVCHGPGAVADVDVVHSVP